MKSSRKVNRLLLVFIGIFVWAISLRAVTTTNESTIYDSDPKHLWNRLNETLFVRTSQDGKKFGLDDLDILFWEDTEHLLIEPSHHQTLAILDEFIKLHGEKLIRDPLERALLQRDLWALFDWLAAKSAGERGELQSRLAVVIRRLALTTNEIASLPDNYARAEINSALSNLPRGLFSSEGGWISLGNQHGGPFAKGHVEYFGGRSVFLVKFRLPDGKNATLAYLERLRSFERPLIDVTNTSSVRPYMSINPELPQFPTNTQWVLIRRMCVIDTEGRIQPTSITESIQRGNVP